MSFSHYLLFVASCILLVIVPGPDMAYLLARTIAQGRRAGSVAVFGISAGGCVHLAAVAAGLSALLLTSVTAFTIVKWVGAAYLLYLGVLALLSRETVTSTVSDAAGRSLRAIFWQGFWSCILNPKVAIFYVALLPQFVDVATGRTGLQLILLGLTETSLALVLHLVLVACAAQLTGRLRRNERFALWLQRAMGMLFIGLGARLAAQKA